VGGSHRLSKGQHDDKNLAANRSVHTTKRLDNARGLVAFMVQGRRPQRFSLDTVIGERDVEFGEWIGSAGTIRPAKDASSFAPRVPLLP
jgi:hypothetical protein